MTTQTPSKTPEEIVVEAVKVKYITGLLDAAKECRINADEYSKGMDKGVAGIFSQACLKCASDIERLIRSQM